MLRWFDRKRSPIGLDIGHRRVKATQSVREGDRWNTLAELVVPRVRPNQRLDQDEARAIVHMLHRAGLSGRRVVLCAPPDAVRTSMIELPPAVDGVPLMQLARMEMARIHKLDAADMEMVAWELPQPDRGRDSTHMIAAVCQHVQIDPTVEVLTAAGLEVVHAFPSTQALIHALQHNLSANKIHALVDLGWSAARIVMVYLNTVIYQRELTDASTMQFYDAIASALGVSDDVVHTMLSVDSADSDQLDPEQLRFSEALQTTQKQHAEVLADCIGAAFTYAAHQYTDAEIGGVHVIGGLTDCGTVMNLMADTLKQRALNLEDVITGHSQEEATVLSRGLVEMWHG